MADLPSGVSQRDVADLLGLSVSTVSRALSDNDRVSDLTKRAVRDAFQTLAARNVRPVRVPNGTTARPMIGLTVSHILDERNPQVLDVNFSEVLAGAEMACVRAGFIPYPWQESRRLIDDEGASFFDHVSGVIMVGGVVDREVIETIRRHDTPAVIAGGQLPGSGISSVGSDNTHGITLAMGHLLDRGHRRIALINGPDATHTSYEKLAGYLTSLVAAGLPFDPALVVSRPPFWGFDETAGDEAATQLLQLDEPPTAIVCAFDQIAVGVYRTAARLGFAVPSDLSVVGFHDDDVARSSVPPLTTIRVRRSQWGEVAAEILLRLREPQPTRGTHTLIPVHLVERESTGPPRASPIASRPHSSGPEGSDSPA